MSRRAWIPWAVLLVAASTAPTVARPAGAAAREDDSAPPRVEVLIGGPESTAGQGEIYLHFSPPPLPGESRRMGDWHHHYRAAMAPVKQAWLEALRAVDRVGLADPAARCRLTKRCAGLRQALAGVSREAILPAPDPVVDLYLRRAMVFLQQAARDCHGERLFLLTYRFRRAGQAYLEVARAMRPYGVAP